MFDNNVTLTVIPDFLSSHRLAMRLDFTACLTLFYRIPHHSSLYNKTRTEWKTINKPKQPDRIIELHLNGSNDNYHYQGRREGG